MFEDQTKSLVCERWWEEVGSGEDEVREESWGQIRESFAGYGMEFGF